MAGIPYDPAIDSNYLCADHLAVGRRNRQPAITDNKFKRDTAYDTLHSVEVKIVMAEFIYGDSKSPL